MQCVAPLTENVHIISTTCTCARALTLVSTYASGRGGEHAVVPVAGRAAAAGGGAGLGGEDGELLPPPELDHARLLPRHAERVVQHVRRHPAQRRRLANHRRVHGAVARLERHPREPLVAGAPRHREALRHHHHLPAPELAVEHPPPLAAHHLQPRAPARRVHRRVRVDVPVRRQDRVLQIKSNTID
uniref:Uncharacterized protein n=1 Tax=Oryza sativa subsp. japonica TaxID=39947 RepID=Q6ZK45_ORYSJ|nr:unknown protein [Oryza sativa Japonica Group]